MVPNGEVYFQFCGAALQEMRAWVALVTQTVEAEFPGFGLLSAMSIFNLNHRTRDAEVGEDGMVHVQEAAQRLCSVFTDVDQQGFIDEFLNVRPIAMHHSKLVSVSSFDAWRRQSERSVADPSKRTPLATLSN